MNQTDVQLAVNMSLGLTSCTANIDGVNLCNAIVIQRVENAAMGSSCRIGNSHSVVLNWKPSVSTDVTGYNVYRGTVSGGPYSKLNSTPVGTTSFTDTSVVSGSTYYYVCTTVDSNNDESVYSGQAQAAVPYP